MNILRDVLSIKCSVIAGPWILFAVYMYMWIKSITKYKTLKWRICPSLLKFKNNTSMYKPKSSHLSAVWLYLNSSPHIYMRQWRLLFDTKPLSTPKLCHCQLDLKNNFQWFFFFIKIQNFSYTKMHLIMSSAKWRPFCPGVDKLIHIPIFNIPFQ